MLTSATDGSQVRIYDGIPQTTHQTVKLQTVLLPLFADVEQQCRQLQEIRTCRTSESRQSLLYNSLSATSFTLMPPTRESSSSSVDRSQPLHRESLRPSGDAGIVPPPDVALSLSMRYIDGVSRCVVFTGSKDAVLVLGRREGAHRFHYSRRRRSVRRLHLRSKVLSLRVESCCVRRRTLG